MVHWHSWRQNINRHKKFLKTLKRICLNIINSLRDQNTAISLILWSRLFHLHVDNKGTQGLNNIPIPVVKKKANFLIALIVFSVSTCFSLFLTRKWFSWNFMVNWVIPMSEIHIKECDVPQSVFQGISWKDWLRLEDPEWAAYSSNGPDRRRSKRKSCCFLLLALPLAGKCLCSVPGTGTAVAATSAIVLLLLHSFIDVRIQFLHNFSKDWRLQLSSNSPSISARSRLLRNPASRMGSYWVLSLSSMQTAIVGLQSSIM